MAETMRGVLAPVVTPYANGAPDAGRLVAHCQRLIDADCGLAVFGTNSEGNSLTVGEKLSLLEALLAAGIPAGRMMPGTGACALPDAIELCRHVTDAGCGGGLALPPFYYKDVSEEGLFRFFAELVEGVGDPRLRLYLYHIPPMAAVGFSLDLIARLIDAFPDVVVGIKDSSRDDANTFAMLERFPGWGVFPGNETNLAGFMAAGAVGTISATCNVNAPAIVDLYRNFNADDAAERQDAVNRVRATFSRWPMIPAMKAAIANALGDDTWCAVRPPLEPLTRAERAALGEALAGIGFSLRP